MKLTIAVLSLCLSAQAQQTNATPDAVIGARNVIGLENVKLNARGTIVVKDNALLFDTGKEKATVPASSIEDMVIGTEATQGGGKAGRAAKTAAIAAPYGSGAGLTLLLHTNVDILTVVYRDADGGRHNAVLAIGKGQAEPLRTQLAAAGGHFNNAPAPPAELKERPAVGPVAPRAKGEKLKASAILIAPVEAGDVQIPGEFRSAIYERLVERVRLGGGFQKVYRTGDRAAENVPDLVILHTTVESFKEGSQLKREIIKVAGATTVDVSMSVVSRDGRALVNDKVTGKVRFFGENLGVTNDIAKKVDKVLLKNF